MLLSNFRPASKLVTKTTRIEKPKFPVIDAHNHLGESYGSGWINCPLNETLAALDSVGVVGYVDLDGSWGEDVLNLHMSCLAPEAERFKRKCSLSDRIHYYRTHPAVQRALEKMMLNLDQIPLPAPLLKQYAPDVYAGIGDKRQAVKPNQILLAKIERVLRDYHWACGNE
jgi:hypothetical protein